MSQEAGTSRYGAIGLGVLGAIVLVALMVQNVWQGQAIAVLESDLAALRTSVAEGRRAEGVAAIGALASMPQGKSDRPKKHKRSGGARAGKRGEHPPKDPAAGARAGKGGKRRAGPPGDGQEPLAP